MYLWEQPDWPVLTWDDSGLASALAQFYRELDRLNGRVEALGADLRREVYLRALTDDVVKSSEIEGEILPLDQVRSSIARRLDFDVGAPVPAERAVEGVVEMILDATRRYDEPLTEERLFAWHAALFPTGRSGMAVIRVGAWRNDSGGPMQVVSGPIGREKVHYEAPPASRLPEEMAAFLHWFEHPSDLDPVLKAGIAHLWFVTVHPFDDGNGRIARAVQDMTLARAEKTGQRPYSLSSQIRRERKAYYDTLGRTEKGGLDVTGWLEWFLACLLRALEDGQQGLAKARFSARIGKEPLNTRQIRMINKLLVGFEGKLTTAKWAKIAKCPQDTAHRDIVDLIERGVLREEPGGGRSPSYSLVLEGAK